jgi:hypothetical protein
LTWGKTQQFSIFCKKRHVSAKETSACGSHTAVQLSEVKFIMFNVC